MATDYLEKKFPTYALTQDTEVMPLKNYYRLDSGSYKRVLDAVATDNPKQKGWYQRVLNHNREFQYNVQSFQVNNICYICSTMARQLLRFPRKNLERESVSGLDWKSSFLDTRWKDLIEDIPSPEYVVPFTMNLYFSKNLNQLVLNIVTRKSIISMLNEFKMVMNTSSSGKTYGEFGYKFETGTLENTSRTDDTYSCAVHWSMIDWRTSRMILQDESRHLSGDSKTTMLRIIEKMDDCARTMVDLAKYVSNITIQDGMEFKCRMIAVPPRFTFMGENLYRLCFSNQLIANSTYGRAFVNNCGVLQMFALVEVKSPAAKFIALDLPEYNPSSYPREEEVLYDDVQSGKIWYTTVPFSGVTV